MDEKRAQYGTLSIDCPLFSTLIFNKFLTNWYYLDIHNSPIFVLII